MGETQWCRLSCRQSISVVVAIVSILAVQVTKSSLYTLFCTSIASLSYTELFKAVIFDALYLVQSVEYMILIYHALIKGNDLLYPLRHMFGCGNHGNTVKCVVALIVLLFIISTGLANCIFGLISEQEFTVSLAIFRFSQIMNFVFDVFMWVFVTGHVFGYMTEWSLPDLKALTTLEEFEKLYQDNGKAERVVRTRLTLQMWFVVHYLIFVTYVYATFRNIAKPYFSQPDNPIHYPTSLPSLILFLVYNILSCLLPFLLGLYMNQAHRNFQKKLLKGFKENQGSESQGTLSTEDSTNPPSLVLCADYEFVPRLFYTEWPLRGIGVNYLWASILIPMGFLVSIPLI